MSLQSKSKKGGPYTKQEQEKRRKQVYELHFEKGFSAVSIGVELGINRNTINEDIKYWLTQIASQFEDQYLGVIILKQIERLEVQKKRLLESIDGSEIDDKLKIEKMLFEIDYKITDYVSKISEKKIRVDFETPEEISYEQASKILKDIVLSERIIFPQHISNDEIMREIVFLTKCDPKPAKNILDVFYKMGLGLFPGEDDEYGESNLASFVIAKGLLNAQEIKELEGKLEENMKEEE